MLLLVKWDLDNCFTALAVILASSCLSFNTSALSQNPPLQGEDSWEPISRRSWPHEVTALGLLYRTHAQHIRGYVHRWFRTCSRPNRGWETLWVDKIPRHVHKWQLRESEGPYVSELLDLPVRLRPHYLLSMNRISTWTNFSALHSHEEQIKTQLQPIVAEGLEGIRLTFHFHLLWYCILGHEALLSLTLDLA